MISYMAKSRRAVVIHSVRVMLISEAEEYRYERIHRY
jgi:hypothetical protein